MLIVLNVLCYILYTAFKRLHQETKHSEYIVRVNQNIKHEEL